ncbi:MAG TPA: FliM/FliN family flagellar motor switch protein [Candidatus Krumholzibacteria bacterium]|nr:FliM/FliN family flagellar motor switch protein [Candidatus Krumholzibacteria bacterium]
MAPERTDHRDDLDLDLEAAIGAASELAGNVDPVGGLDMEAVLNADSAVDAAMSGPRPYDFNRPHNISRAFANNLQAVAEGFAKMAGIDFTSLVRASVQVDYRGLRQSTYGEYLEELPNPTCAALVTFEPLKGQSILHLDLGLCFVFMQKLLGGALDAQTTVREFTEIERGINTGLIERLNEILRRSFAKLIDVRPGVVRQENNPGYLGGMAEGESLIILRFGITVGAAEGPCDIALPMTAFGPVREIFDPSEAVEIRTENELREDRRHILSMVQGTASDLVVELASFEANLEEVLALKEGQLLRLPQSVDAPLKVRIEGQDSWLGEAGRIGQKRAVRLVRKLTKE